MAAVEELVEDKVAERLGRLESNVGHLQADVTEIKVDFRQFRSEMLARFDKVDARSERMAAETNARFDKLIAEMGELRDRTTKGDLHTRIWMLGLIGVVLGVMAHGFKWI
jgi:hypothetical protein